MLEEIEKILENSPNEEGIKTIPRDLIFEHMKSDNIEVLGALYVLLTDDKFYTRIEPPIPFRNYFPFVLEYLGRCLVENPDGIWSDSDYTAGWNLTAWFNGLWKERTEYKKEIDKVKKWLSDLYLNGNDELRLCIETAILEHLFENKQVAAYFNDWKQNSILNKAYQNSVIL